MTSILQSRVISRLTHALQESLDRTGAENETDLMGAPEVVAALNKITGKEAAETSLAALKSGFSADVVALLTSGDFEPKNATDLARQICLCTAVVIRGGSAPEKPAEEQPFICI